MNLEERAVSDALGTILFHNVMDDAAKRVVRKGTRLTEEHLAKLTAVGRDTIQVAVLGPDDVPEDEAARLLAEALLTAEIDLSRPAGGRINLQATVDGLLEVNEASLLEINTLPGFALATRRQHTVVGPNQATDNIATLKIVPFAVERRHLDRALALAEADPPVLRVRHFVPGRRVAMLFVADEAVHEKLRGEYLPPTQARLARLRADLVVTEDVIQDEEAIAAAAARLAQQADLLIIAGQTSIMDEEDTTLRALRMAGATGTVSGAPVEPGNLLALAYFPDTPVMCAPGCAKGLKRNVVDLVLPRLLLSDRLDGGDIAALGLGGFLTAAERAGDIT
jgi:molybdenum cofactor cytidylyltransferase